MPDHPLPPTTAGIRPELFPDEFSFSRGRLTVAVLLAVFVVVGFGFRVNQLGTESLGEDELNKLETVQEYRANGLTGKNGEHPFLMKGLQTLSISTAEVLPLSISKEAALRFPIALFGTFTSLLLFLLVSELFGRSIGIVAAGLWAVEPAAIGFDRIAKEDSLVIFFFLLTGYLWVRSQTLAETGKKQWIWHAWAAGVAFAGLMASKYYPHLLAVPPAYYNVFNRLPGKRWNMGKIRWLVFVMVMGIAFLILNPTIMLPDTWREMLKFSSENRIGHDSYEYMGELYRNQMTAWLSGVPWTFYYVFLLVKTSLSTLVLALVGLPLLFRRRMGDGRYFLFFWAFMWFLPFTFLGGKFTRYFTLVEPLVLISAAVAFCWVLNRLPQSGWLQAVFLAVVLGLPLINAAAAGPHYRLFTNSIGIALRDQGSYFPHDEFYDASTRTILKQIAELSPQAAVTIACETPGLFEFYASEIGRDDIAAVSLSDPEAVARLTEGDFIVLAEGRRYRSNDRYISYLKAITPTAETTMNGVRSARIYRLDAHVAAAIQSLATQR